MTVGFRCALDLLLCKGDSNLDQRLSCFFKIDIKGLFHGDFFLSLNLEFISRTTVRALAIHFVERTPISCMRNDMTAFAISRIHINSGAVREFNGEVGFKFVKFFEDRLSDIGNAHLASDLYLHNLSIARISIRRYLWYISSIYPTFAN